MDKLIAEKEVELKKERKKRNLLKPLVVEKAPPTHKTEYLNSLENVTLAELKKREEKKQNEDFVKEKEILIQQQFSENKAMEETSMQQTSQKVIEKPNYDLIEEDKKIVKLKKTDKPKSKSKKRVAGIVLACTLGASAIVCVANTFVLENLNSQFLQIDEIYKFNLASYLKNIYNLDVTQKSMEMIETYPEEILDAGDLGQKSNWFDRLCNFIGGLFGG